MRVLGLDPGLARIGFAVVEREASGVLVLRTCGVIRTTPDRSLGERLVEVKRDLGSILDRHAPHAAAVEQIFFNRNVQTATLVAQTRGVLLLTLAERGIAAHDYTPQAIKMAVIGYGKARKSQVQDMVRRILDLAEIPRPPDAADATAAALCHQFTMGRQKKTATGRPFLQL